MCCETYYFVVIPDPRSASENVEKTPIAISNDNNTPVKTMALIDPRSPGCVLGGKILSVTIVIC